MPELRRGVLRHHLFKEDGQALVFVMVLVVPFLFGIAALVIDGSKLFVERRTLQNAADASALAAAREIDPFGSPCGSLLGCDANVIAKIQSYSGANDGPSTGIHACASNADTNCYQTPYKGDTGRIQVRLSRGVNDPFGRFAKSIGVNNLKASASAVASVTAGGVPQVMYAMNAQANSAGNECKGIQVQGSNNSFTATWSNGYYEPGVGSAVNNSAPTALYGAVGACNNNFFVPNNPNFGVPQKLQAPKRCDTCWPKPLPDVSIATGLCKTATQQPSINVGTNNGNADWPSHNPPGIYCATSGGVGNGVTIGDKLPVGTDLRGYTFIAINGTVTTTSTGTLYGPATGASNVTFYAGGGGVTIGSSASWAGDIYSPSPNSQISFKANGANIPFTGFLEGDSISVQADGVTFVGSGPLVGDPHVGLEE